MYKSNYVEFNKVYNFIEELEDNYLFLSNVKYYKNPTIKNQEILKEKFSNYFKYEKTLRQKYKNKKNIEGYSLKILISPTLLKREHRKNLRKYINNTIELITNIGEEKIRWVATKEKTRGNSIYLNIYFIDRIIYERKRVVERKIYLDKETGKFTKKKENSKVKIVKKDMLCSDKIRFRLAQHKSKTEFINLMSILKENIKKIEKSIFSNEIKVFYDLKKETLKKKVEIKGKVYYVNNNENIFNDIKTEYKRRYIRAYNSLINSIVLNSNSLQHLNLDNLKKSLKSIKEKHFNNVYEYEKKLLEYERIIQKEPEDFIKIFEIK